MTDQTINRIALEYPADFAILAAGLWSDLGAHPPPEIPKVVYTTNAIESRNMVIREYIRNRRIFPNDDSALKSLFMAIREASKNWKSIRHWKAALQSFQVMFGEERLPLAAL